MYVWIEILSFGNKYKKKMRHIKNRDSVNKDIYGFLEHCLSRPCIKYDIWERDISP